MLFIGSLPLTRFIFSTWCNAVMSFVEGEIRSACFDAADVPNKNVAKILVINRAALLPRQLSWLLFLLLYI